MSNIIVTEENDSIFGKLIKITNGIIDLKVTVDFGPRVIYFAAAGQENIFYQDTEKRPLGEVQPCYDGDIIRLYGGHRIWISPEEMPRCYYPDNSPVTFTREGNSFIFTAPIEKVNNIQKILTISLEEDTPVVAVDNVIKNCGVWDIELAPWSITQLAPGGFEVVPQTKRETGYLHNRYMVLWPYSKMNDERVYWGNDFVTLKQDEKADCAFKFGTNNEDGWAAYFNKGQVFFKFFEPQIDGDYPDNGCCYETYTNDCMIEMEALGEFEVLAPNEELRLSEEWEIHVEANVPDRKNEAEIKKVLGKFIEL